MDILDVVSVAGLILAFGAALDVSLKRSMKRSVSSAITNFAQRSVSYRFGGTAAADRIFGRKLLGSRAVIRYTVLSLLSLAFSYGFAYFTSDADLVAIFHRPISSLDIILLVVFLTASIAADIFSYAQTRLFLRAVDRFKNSVVSLGMVVADGLISVGLFILFFSFARCLAYILVLQNVASGPASTSDTFWPLALKQTVHDNRLMPVQGRKEDAAWRLYGAMIKGPPPRPRAIEGAAKVVDRINSPSSSVFNKLKYTASYRCIADAQELDADTAASSLSFFEGLVLSSDLSSTDQVWAKARGTQYISEYYRDRLLSAVEGKGCTPAVSIKREVTYPSLLSIAGPANAYLAAFERTLFDAHTIIAFKFGPYVAVDPYGSVRDYFIALGAVSRMTFLQLSRPNQDRVHIFDTMTELPEIDRKGVAIPFSALLASSLTVTIFFAAYLFGALLASVRQNFLKLISWVLPSFELDKAVFTTIATLCVGLWVAATLAGAALGKAWQIILG